MHPLLHGKPAVKILLPFMAGIACARQFSLAWPWPAAAAALLLLLAFIVRRRASCLFSFAALAAFFCAGWLRLALVEQVVPPDDIRRMADWPAPLSLEGVISAPVEERTDRSIFRLTVDSLWSEERGFAARGHARVIWYDTLTTLRQGDRVVVKGMLRSPGGAHNPGDFDYRAWLAARGIHVQLTAAGGSRLLLLERDQDPLLQRRVIRPIRDHILATVRSGLAGEEQALLSALLVGVRTGIDDELREEFSRVGVVHVLAVSGLHVGFILAALLLFISLLRIPHRARLPVLLAALYLYVLITGSAPPVVRAAVTAALLLAAPMLQRRFNPVNAVALAAMIILLFNPLDLFGAGFQLSFAATLGILLIYRRLDRWAAGRLPQWRQWRHPWRKSALQLLMVSLAAQIATLPLTAWYFNTLPLWGLAANLAVVPLVSLIVTIGFIAVLFALISPLAGFIFLQCDWLLLKLLTGIVHGAAAMPASALEVPTPPLAVLAGYYMAVALILSWPQRRAVLAWSLALLVTANFWIWPRALQPQNQIRVVFFDVGQGDAALISFPNHVHYLIDSGEANERFDCGRSLLLPWLRRNGIRAVDMAFITHTHSDHAGGVQTLMRRGRIRELGHPGGAALPAFRALDSLAAQCGVPVRPLTAGDDFFPAQGAWLRILQAGGAGGEQWDENNGSMVIRLQYGGRVFLFLADIEAEGERSLLRCGDFLRSDVVKVAHHGSATASSEEMLAAAGAGWAVISVGRYNRFALPDPIVVARWLGNGSRVLSTDKHGAVIFRSDGESLRCLRPENISLSTGEK
ncbi:MAG TPA: DNA internalization-related competence protein ComEC/Rec2 [bacterium]|nr:DNA internalization-related competence protein ComEC/Rec2 [bacterium]